MTRGLVPAAALIGLLLLARAPARGDTAPEARLLEGDARIVHVLNRMGYGPRPGDVERVRRMGLDNYVSLQLHPTLVPDEACEERLAPLETFRLSAAEFEAQNPAPTPKERKKLAELLAQAQKASGEEKKALQAKIRRMQKKSDRNRALYELMSAKMIRAVYSERQLAQVLADFWFNHFNVFARKSRCALLLPEFEESVLRPRVLGSFRDLLGATARSPAMLVYLDNWMSAAAADAPVAAKRRGRRRGLNENYARELLELHTLGVDGGYTQKDVIEVARCFTGWTLSGKGANGRTFAFRPEMHDAGPKKVLGLRIRPGRGVEDGEKVLDYLARHPSTARHLSLKLCRRFVADDPPATLVARCATIYLATDGDLRAVLTTLFESDEFMSTAVAGRKIKKPHEAVASAVRALGVETTFPRNLLSSLGRIGEPLYHCEPPTGFGDALEDWSGTNEVLNRVNFAMALAAGRLRGIEPDWNAILAGAPGRDAAVLAPWLAERLLGRPLAPSSKAALDAVLARTGEMAVAARGRRGSGNETAIALAAVILASPDFQMQ